MKILPVSIIFVVAFVGCGLANSNYITYNFEKDKVMVANVGEEMLNWTQIYKNDVYGTVISSFEQTLTYSGKQGNVIKIFYREASNNMARPSFTQELTYDLTDEKIITFKQTKIKVEEVTNNLIKFTVLESPAYQYKSGEKITGQPTERQKSKIKNDNVFDIYDPPKNAIIETHSQGAQEVKITGESDVSYKVKFPNNSVDLIKKDSVISIRYIR